MKRQWHRLLTDKTGARVAVHRQGRGRESQLIAIRDGDVSERRSDLETSAV